VSIRCLQDISTPGLSRDLLALQLINMMVRNSMTAAYLSKQPQLFDKWSSMNPLGRLGRPDELRGVVTWLASDASTFCTGSEYVVYVHFLPSGWAN
jgi:NAD(P)-dependent dehydrogenase (short-subunit alcohol dehydrogenase family)